MTNRQDLIDRITDDIDELVNGATTTETVDRLTHVKGHWRASKARHTVHHPPLLAQLRAATTGSTMTSEDTFRPIPGSKPSARLDAIATLARIDQQSLSWAQVLRSRRRVPLDDRLRGLIGAAVAADVDQLAGRAGLASAVRSWRTAARVVSGIEAPAFAPDVPCPNTDCEKRGSLRVRFDLRVAACVECGAFWDSEHVEQLGRIVAWSAEHLSGPRHWLHDAEGFPLECMECLLTRQEMAERARGRLAATRPVARGA
ncbi:DUF7341 domain-containing protein [Angustibacter sp. McL0619]|uniref:DUF7341 domain-containing protein n=1 Tax=Angustibacter sp. McL0619 TaxID=3415676 RepID=UPI003CE67AA8